MGKPHSKRDQHCILMSHKLNRLLQDQIGKKKCGFNLTNYDVHSSSLSEFSICCFDSSNKATEIPLKVDLPPRKMPVGTSNPHGILLQSQIMNRCDGISKSSHSAADTNDDNCNKIEPFEYELQVDTSSEKKQDWSFTLYDFDGNGKITKEELSNLFQALYDAVGSSIHLPLNGTKKIKLRLSIGHDSSHVDKTLKDQSPLLVKKKAKLKNTSKLTEWKEMSLQAGASQVDGVAMVDSKEYTKLNNLDASPRTKPSTVCKMENQLTPAPPGIGHRLTLSCREQKKLTEMVHENMVRNQVRQQTGRKHHHTGHRYHHLHREARRHRSARRHGDENRKPREKDATHYLDVGGIEQSSRKAVILPYSSGVPNTTSTTTATVTTTSVMTFTRPVINIVPSSSSSLPLPPPPPPPPTASGSTAHCNEIGMPADDDDDENYDETNVVKTEVGGNGTCRKQEMTWRKTRLEENVIGEDGLTVEISVPQDPQHLHQQPRHLHHHHHHHHHRHRHHHPHRSSGDGEHAKCKHCPEKCTSFNAEHLKSCTNAPVINEVLNKSEKKEIFNRKHKHNNNTNANNNDNEINRDLTEKDVNNIHMSHPLSSTSGVDMTKQENLFPTSKCHNSNANIKPNFDCVCSRCQKRACQVRTKSTGSWLVKNENEPQQRKDNAPVDVQETTPEIKALSSATANTVTTGTVVTSMTRAPTISASSPYEKKTTERSSKRGAEERYKKQNEAHHHAQHSGRTRSQDCGVEQAPAVSSSVSAVVTKMTAPGATAGSIAERKSLRTHHKNDSSPQRTSNRHRTHCQNTLVPEKHAGGPPSSSVILHPPVSPPPPAPTPTTAAGVTPSMATTTMTSTMLQQQQQQQHHHHHHPRRRNHSSRNKEFNEAMQQVADWVNREHNPQAQPINDEHPVRVQRHEHHHVHEYHHHHHYHHCYQT